MKSRYLILLGCINALVVVSCVVEDHRALRGNSGVRVVTPPPQPVVVHARTAPAPVVVAPAPAHHQPVAVVRVGFSDDERRIFRGYYREGHGHSAPAVAGRKGKGLPPGLAKKAARGRELPPGWQKKCVKGEILPVEVYARCEPIPHDLVVKLPAPPPGVITITVEGKIVRLLQATREILDVFEVPGF